jgi:hypothetical protein
VALTRTSASGRAGYGESAGSAPRIATPSRWDLSPSARGGPIETHLRRQMNAMTDPSVRVRQVAELACYPRRLPVHWRIAHRRPRQHDGYAAQTGRPVAGRSSGSIRGVPSVRRARGARSPVRDAAVVAHHGSPSWRNSELSIPGRMRGRRRQGRERCGAGCQRRQRWRGGSVEHFHVSLHVAVRGETSGRSYLARADDMRRRARRRRKG